MAAGARDLARPSGSSGISTTTIPAPASTGGARQAPTISSCASANGRRRIPCGCGSTSRPPCVPLAACRGHQGEPRRGAGACARRASARAGERVGVLGSRPYTGRNASRRVAEILVEGHKQGDRACRRRRRSAASPSACCSAISSSRWRRPPRAIEAIAAQGVRGHLVQILDPAEETLPYEGRTEFSRERRPRPSDRRPRRDFARTLPGAADRHRNALVAETKRLHWSFLVHHTDRPAEEVVLAIHNRLAGLERDYRFRPTTPVAVGAGSQP